MVNNAGYVPVRSVLKVQYITDLIYCVLTPNLDAVYVGAFLLKSIYVKL